MCSLILQKAYKTRSRAVFQKGSLYGVQCIKRCRSSQEPAFPGMHIPAAFSQPHLVTKNSSFFKSIHIHICCFSHLLLFVLYKSHEYKFRNLLVHQFCHPIQPTVQNKRSTVIKITDKPINSKIYKEKYLKG